ncbi:BcsR/BcsP family cellulose biosynthesis protein [Ferrigenium kumadai]|uniref:BcsR/BcsP family cellulose biosynthesis protein n=1 Tax=Ferrigenium kumadai TaxID=1682490 RepID=UPI003CCE7C3F
MRDHSDIAGLFSKLTYDTERYQEIGALHRLEATGSRWALLQEIHCSMPLARSMPTAEHERPHPE